MFQSGFSQYLSTWNFQLFYTNGTTKFTNFFFVLLFVGCFCFTASAKIFIDFLQSYFESIQIHFIALAQQYLISLYGSQFWKLR